MNPLKQLLLPLLLLALVVACAMNRDSVRTHAPELLPQYEAAEAKEAELKAELETAKAELEAAQATEDTSDDQAAEARIRELAPKLEDLERQFLDLEQAFNRRQVEPFLGPLDPFIPGGKELITLGLLPLLGRRGRKHYGNALRNVPRGQLLTALGDIIKAFGLQHSTPQSAQAAEAASKPTAS